MPSFSPLMNIATVISMISLKLVPLPAVGSVASVKSSVLLMACTKFIRVVSPKTEIRPKSYPYNLQKNFLSISCFTYDLDKLED